MNLEQALRKKYRFPSQIGNLTLEQLWDLPLKGRNNASADLDGVAKAVNAKLKAESEESFVEVSVNKHKEDLENMLEIVKHVIKVRQDEIKASEDLASKAARKRELLELLHDKNKEALRNKTPAELEAMIAEL
jgi:hypothetical protein